MKQLLQELNQLDEIKAVKKFNDRVLKIQLFTRDIKGSDAVEIRGDIQSISQKLIRRLNDAARKRPGGLRQDNGEGVIVYSSSLSMYSTALCNTSGLHAPVVSA